MSLECFPSGKLYICAFNDWEIRIVNKCDWVILRMSICLQLKNIINFPKHNRYILSSLIYSLTNSPVFHFNVSVMKLTKHILQTISICSFITKYMRVLSNMQLFEWFFLLLKTEKKTFLSKFSEKYKTVFSYIQPEVFYLSLSGYR